MLPPSLFIHHSTRTGRTIVEMHVANEAGVVVVLAVSGDAGHEGVHSSDDGGGAAHGNDVMTDEAIERFDGIKEETWSGVSPRRRVSLQFASIKKWNKHRRKLACK
jgi:hypothetical protein